LTISDVIDHRRDKRKVLICGRNMHRMRTEEKSIVQLELNRWTAFLLKVGLPGHVT
jgi:hypothetical protein